MELTPTQISALQNLTVSSGKVSTESLSVGQQLLAKVIAANNATGEVTLSINNALLNTKSSIPLTPGQTLQLLVAQLGKELVLQLPQVLIEQAITQKTLRESLPKQESQAETLRNLQHFVTQGKKSGVSEKIIQFTQKFLQQLPGTKQLSQAQGLKEVIQRSGIFLENKLANINPQSSKNNISNDFKSFLLQLKSLLVNERNETAKQTPPTQGKTSTNNPQLPATETKILDLAKQIKLTDDGKLSAEKQLTQSTSEQVKNALQQALAKINQQQKNISQNLSRLLAATNTKSTAGTALPGQITNPLTAPQTTPTILTPNSPNVVKPASIALNDALAFTTNAQKSQQPEINFSRLNNLMDLLDTLIKQVDAGISRTQLHQLNSLLEPDGGKLGWSMEIPVKIDDELHSIHLHLEKEPGADEDSDPVLTVNIALDLENLGPVYARITLVAENVGIVFWAEREETYQLTQQHVENLQSNLHKSGLKPDNISFHHGQPPEKPVLNKAFNESQQNGILDIKV